MPDSSAASEPDRAALQRLGLTRYESAGYLALLAREHASPTEVARLAGIPRPRVYDVLTSLAARRMARVVGDKPLRYAAEPPEQALERLIEQRQEEAARTAATARACAGRLTSVYLAGQHHDDPMDYVEVVLDSAEAGRRVHELWNAAERDVMTFVRPPFLAPPGSVQEATVLPPPVRQRALYDAELLGDDEMVRLLQRFAELGEEVRVAAHLPLKLTIVDGRSVAFNMADPVAADTSVTTVLIHHASLAATLTIAFESVWAQATPLAETVATLSAVSPAE